MKKTIRYILIALFGIFIGSQITEGALMVPHWQSLQADEFYSFYREFGPMISSYFTILTIMALLIPLGTAISMYFVKSKGLKYAIISSVFALLFIGCFYIYFKDINEAFINGAFVGSDLKVELEKWSTWHWSRVGLEILSLLFLVLAFREDS